MTVPQRCQSEAETLEQALTEVLAEAGVKFPWRYAKSMMKVLDPQRLDILRETCHTCMKTHTTKEMA